MSKDWPHQCDRCQSPALRLFSSTECSKAGCANYRAPKASALELSAVVNGVLVFSSAKSLTVQGVKLVTSPSGGGLTRPGLLAGNPAMVTDPSSAAYGSTFLVKALDFGLNQVILEDHANRAFTCSIGMVTEYSPFRNHQVGDSVKVVHRNFVCDGQVGKVTAVNADPSGFSWVYDVLFFNGPVTLDHKHIVATLAGMTGVQGAMPRPTGPQSTIGVTGPTGAAGPPGCPTGAQGLVGSPGQVSVVGPTGRTPIVGGFAMVVDQNARDYGMAFLVDYLDLMTGTARLQISKTPTSVVYNSFYLNNLCAYDPGTPHSVGAQVKVINKNHFFDGQTGEVTAFYNASVGRYVYNIKFSASQHGSASHVALVAG